VNEDVCDGGTATHRSKYVLGLVRKSGDAIREEVRRGERNGEHGCDQPLTLGHYCERYSVFVVTGAKLAGISAGDRVVIRARNSPEILDFVMACLRAGVAPALLGALATERELREMTADIQAAAVIDDASLDRVDEIRAIATTEAIMCRPMHFTSGTSGRPKAVWSGWLSPDDAQAWIADETTTWDITAEDVHLVCGPLNHSAPLRFALMTLLAGGSVVVPAKFDPTVVAQLLAEGSVTTTFMAPAHLQRLRDHLDGGSVTHHLRLLAHAGSACPDAVRSWAHETFGLDVVYEFYGSTEGQFTQCSAREWVEHPGTVGKTRPGREIRVDDDGLIWCRAPEFTRFSYWGDPEKTAAAWRDDFFTVGDYGRLDEDGYLYLQGRKGDLIITGGVNVYPAELERVLANLPGVDQVVAFGLPDDTWGQRVCIAIGGSVSESAVHDFVREQLSGAKRPKSVFVASSLPTTHSGKVDRVATTALYS